MNTKLEDTLISMANDRVEMLNHHMINNEPDQFEIIWHELCPLLMLGNIKDSGLTNISTTKLLEIEDNVRAINKKFITKYKSS